MVDEEPGRWEARPLLGAALHAALVAIPVILGAGIGLVARDLLPDPLAFGIPPWVVAGSVGMAVVWLVQPLTRRLIPLSWLLKLAMLFPGRAPDRFAIARQSGRLRELEERLASAVHDPGERTAQRSAELILALVTALTAHDRRTRGHAERTRVFTDLLSEELGLPQGDRDRLRWAALLHDIGKLEVSQRLLNKPGRPTTREWEQLRAHPEAGDRLVAPLREWLGEWADTVLHHHERWDGAGYPAGLAGEQIALGARIVAVADVYDVMTAVRSYKRPSSAAVARQELVSCAGSQFDPAVVRAFLSIPLPRLRWALGPLAWVAQLPGVRETAHTGAGVQVGAQQAAASAPAAVGAAAAVSALVVGANAVPPPAAFLVDSASAEEGDGEVEPARIGDTDAGEYTADQDRARRAIRAMQVRLATQDVRAGDTGGSVEAAGDGDRLAGSGEASSAGPGGQAPATDAVGAPSDVATGGGASDPAPSRAGEGRGRGPEPASEPPPAPGSAPAAEPATSPAPARSAGRGDEPRPTATTGGDPPAKEACFDDGWQGYGFGNQGQCVRSVQTGHDSRGDG